MRNHAQALAEPSKSILQSEGFFNESTLRQSTNRNPDRSRRSRDPPALKKDRDQEMAQKLKKSQQVSSQAKLKGRKNRDYADNGNLLDSMELTDPEQSGYDQQPSKARRKPDPRDAKLPKDSKNR